MGRSLRLAAIEIESVGPLPFAEQAAQILREAWPRPVLHYTPSYLAWQWSFPGPAAQGFVAREAGEPVGVFSLFPRRLRFRGTVSDAFVASFLAVRPAFRGRGVSNQLYAALLLACRAAGLPAVIYAEARSEAALRPLHGTSERLGVQVKKLGQYANHAFVPRARQGGAPTAAVAVETTDLGLVLAAIAPCVSDATLWSLPGRAELAHYLRDPRPRKLLVVKEGDRTVGAGMASLDEVATASGIDRVSTLDSVFFPEPTADRILALARAAAQVFAGNTTSPVVSAPSLATIPAEMLAAAGIRRSGAVFDGFVVSGESHPFLGAEVTNLEVV
jgi:GNAT superfamily N-acetyltransferase